MRIIPTAERTEFDRLVEAVSGHADLTIPGLTEARLNEKGPALL